MPVELRAALALTTALVLVWALTPLVIRLAVATDFYDRPRGYKKHAAATPYLGGLAVLAGFVPAALVFGGAGRLWPVLAGMGGLAVVGTLDDRHGLGVTVRLLAETGAALLLWTADLGWSATGSEAVDLVLTVVWVLALVNALNLLDNLDGAAGSVGAAIGLGIGVMAAHRGDAGLAALCFALSGACLGFLRLNLASPRARIFLGDGGSLAIGFGLAAAAMALPGQEPGLPILALALVGVPLLDTALVTVSRLRRGVTLLTGGRDHVTHRLLTRLGSPRRVALVLAVVQLALAGAALWLAEYGTGGAIVLGALYAIGVLVCIAILERPAWRSSDWATGSPASVRGDVATVRQR